MLLAVLVLRAGIWQKLLFQINLSEDGCKIIINTHTTSCPLHQLPVTTASTLLIAEFECRMWDEHWMSQDFQESCSI